MMPLGFRPKFLVPIVVLAFFLAASVWWVCFLGNPQANENAAYSAVARMHNAQIQYSSQWRVRRDDQEYWMKDVAGLCRLSPNIPAGVAEADTTPTAGSKTTAKPYHGYFFRALPVVDTGDDPPRGGYGICAYPAVYGKTGKSTFFINGLGIYRRDTEGRCLDRALGQSQLQQGWAIID